MLTFTMLQRFYQTYWFYVACAAAAGLVAWAGYRYRVRQVEARFNVVLGERSRIAREIHDTLAQNFVAISAQLETVARLFRSAPDSAIGHLDQARVLVRSGLAEARRSVMGLRPLALEGGDLPAALRQIAGQLALSASIHVHITGEVRRLAPALEANLLRIAQEAITNAI